MAITQAMCTSFKEDLLDKEMDMDADTIKIALYTSSATLNAATTFRIVFPAAGANAIIRIA